MHERREWAGSGALITSFMIFLFTNAALYYKAVLTPRQKKHGQYRSVENNRVYNLTGYSTFRASTNIVHTILIFNTWEHDLNHVDTEHAAEQNMCSTLNGQPGENLVTGTPQH